MTGISGLVGLVYNDENSAWEREAWQPAALRRLPAQGQQRIVHGGGLAAWRGRLLHRRKTNLSLQSRLALEPLNPRLA